MFDNLIHIHPYTFFVVFERFNQENLVFINSFREKLASFKPWTTDMKDSLFTETIFIYIQTTYFYSLLFFLIFKDNLLA